MKMIPELADKPENVSHNLKVRTHNAAVAGAKDELAQGLKESRDNLACDIEQSMRNGKATLRLKRLMTKHKDGEAHKGDEMLQELLLLKGKVGLLDEKVTHDRIVQAAEDNSLSDGCAATEYTVKVNDLIENHIPHMRRSFDDDEAIAEYLVRLMPRVNAAEGRALIRELSEKSSLDPSTAVQRCTAIVLASEPPELKVATTTRSARPSPLGRARTCCTRCLPLRRCHRAGPSTCSRLTWTRCRASTPSACRSPSPPCSARASRPSNLGTATSSPPCRER